MRGWGSVAEDDWPYESCKGDWPPREPPGLDTSAKAHRIFVYQRVRTVNEAKLALAADRPVALAVEINNEWYSARNGDISLPRKAVTGAHSIFLVGYDDNTQRFTFQNSWGTQWGDSGFGSLLYEYFDLYNLEAWSFPDHVTAQPAPIQRQGIIEFEWGIPELFRPALLHGVEFFDATNNECVAWAFLVMRDRYVDIEELFVRPQYRRRGYGTQIAKTLRRRSEKYQLRLRCWIAHPDAVRHANSAATRILDRLSLTARPANVKWAAAVAT
jgi:GNAT superfamily N-acetyltransferase